jgi:type IX secretion system PorP/SprF family membrane protein
MMTRRSILFIFLLTGIFIVNLQSQDLHFSQFYQAPLMYNPAMSGQFDGDLRIGVHFRDQWASISVPYRTFSGWADYKLINGAGQTLTVGLLFLYDRAGDGKLTTNKIFGNIAYNLNLNREWSVSIGLAGGYVQKQLDFNLLTFDAQWTSTGFNPAIPSNELLDNQKLNYPDAAAGIVLNYKPTTGLHLYGGISLKHLLKPKESFYNLNNKLGWQTLIHGGMDLVLNEQFSLETGFVFQAQKKAQNWLLGGNMGYDLGDDNHTTLYAGLWYRGVGDIIPTAGIEYKSIKGFLSYDFNLGQVKQTSRSFGAAELSLIYILKKKPKVQRIVVPCIRY